jgi:phage portal protein BeeE
MAVLRRKVKTAAYGAEAPVKAAAGSVGVGQFLSYMTNQSERVALQVPTVSRAHDLIASIIGATPLKLYTRQWNGEEYDRTYLPLESWMERPDPKATRQFLMVNTFTDLYLYGRAFWYITTRYSNGFPASFTWLPYANISTPDQAGPVWFGPSPEIEFNGMMLEPLNVVQFISPIMGVAFAGQKAINTAFYLQQAIDKMATLEQTPGWLQQKGGETLSGDELAELAGSLASARKSNVMFALNDMVEFHEYSRDQLEVLGDQRQYQALELSRVANIPPWLLGIDVGGLTYQNAQDARLQLYLYGAKPYMDVIEQTLSGDTIIPRGRFVEFDIESYIGEMMDDTPITDRSDDAAVSR